MQRFQVTVSFNVWPVGTVSRCEPVRGLSSAIQPFFPRDPKRSTHCQVIHDFSSSPTGPWQPNVSPNLHVRIVLVIDTVSPLHYSLDHRY